ncbi:MAG TPA: type II toxin-antitoxin system VapC family toxin [Methylomirabilota bacterium]|nr:type II toxin-antitoxin system VapC family toxin [Methylomirabilota bacterium]
MIVVDTNVIASLVLPTGSRTDSAMRLLELDRDWCAPVLWRSELTNVLATGVRTRWFDLDFALQALDAACDVIGDNEFSVPSAPVLELAAETGCTAYDAEFAYLARELSVPLVTLDRQLLRAFPELARSTDDYLSGVR